MPINLADLKRQIEEARLDYLSRIDKVPIAALVWGPNPTSTDPVAQTRVFLRDALRSRGHYAEFSEDLYDPSSNRSLYAQQLAQAEAFDIVFSIPSSFGSIGEIHDFARIPGLSHKVTAFIDQAHTMGYSALTLQAAQTNASCKVELYDGRNCHTVLLMLH
jgi:hypothetical protein